MKRDLSKGSIVKHIINLSLPMMVAFLFHIGFNIVDTIFIGRVSTDALAAISLTFPVIFFIIAIASGVGIGATSLIARLLGAKKIKEAENTAMHSLILSLIITVCVSILGIVFAKPLFSYLGADENIMPLVLSYSYIIFSGAIFMFVAFMGNSILRGTGDMKTPMKVMMLATIINIILDPILIFGFYFIPTMGIAGAAIATVIARFTASIYVLAYLLKGKSSLKIEFKHFNFKPKVIRDILNVGIPASLSQAIMSLGIFFLTKIVSLFGPLAIAAFGIAGRLDMIAILPVIGIATAVVTIVGFNVGAKEYKRAGKTVLAASLIAFIFMEIVALILFITPEFWISIFNKHPTILSIGSSYLRIVAFSYGIAGIGIIISSAFQGAGKGYPSLVLTALRLFIIAIPAAYLFAVPLSYGTNGIWWGIVLGTVISTIVAIVWFMLGTWKKGHPEVKEIPEAVV